MKVISEISGTKEKFNAFGGGVVGDYIHNFIPASTVPIKMYCQNPFSSLLITCSTPFLCFIFENISGYCNARKNVKRIKHKEFGNKTITQVMIPFISKTSRLRLLCL